MCDLGNCTAPATHYVVVEAQQKPPTNPVRRRLEVCRDDLHLGQRLEDAGMTKIIEYGRLDAAWVVHPGGVSK